jgi:hypothetical protein
MRKGRKNINNLGRRIERVRIPNEDMGGWIKVLGEGGYVYRIN